MESCPPGTWYAACHFPNHRIQNHVWKCVQGKHQHKSYSNLKQFWWCGKQGVLGVPYIVSHALVDLATTRLWGYHGLSFWGVHYIVFHAPKALSIVHQQSSKYKGSCLNLSACLAFIKDKFGGKSRGNMCRAGNGQRTFKLGASLA